MKSVLQTNVLKPSNMAVAVLNTEQSTFMEGLCKAELLAWEVTERLERYKNILESINRSYIMQV